MTGAVDRIQTALQRIRAAWPLLDDHRDASTARRRPESRQMGRTAAASLDNLLRAERGERLGRQATLSAPTPAPANLDLVDAETLVVVTLRDHAWLAASTLRDRAFHWPPLAWTVTAACDFLTVAARHIPPTLARDTADALDAAVKALEGALQLDRHDDEIYRAGHWWVTATAAARRLGCTRDNVYDWARRGLVVDEHGAEHSLTGAGQRWHRLVDIRRAARTVGRQPSEAA